MTLFEFICKKHRDLDLNLNETHKLVGTKKRFTRMVNTSPERATLTDVLRLSARMAVHPLTLINKYGLGKLMITKEDKRLLLSHYNVKPTALRHETHTPLTTGAEVAGANP